MQGLVNWRLIRERMLGPVHRGAMPAVNWDDITEMYDGMARLERRFTQMQVDCMPITADDTVVDIGCGPGRLTVPMAKKARSVTSVDAFSNMLARCQHNVREAGLSNVVALQQDWQQEDAVAQIGVHDIAVASRSVGFYDLLKLNRIARKYAVVLSFANAPSLREIQLSFLAGISDVPQHRFQEEDRLLSYNVTFNMLYDMGAEPNIRILDDGFEAEFSHKQEAYDALRFVGEIPPDKEALYQANVDKHLTPTESGWRLFCPTRSYVMWWHTAELKC
ncbi:class I SAM-dependent methyltransferase [Shewanella dokdonensis]|uniref:Methyltransferase domain-containing protein n=1 Tax=Shewanella dokdonensis TaxID=712036 RepID=A0ABX8DBE3_9GAMM|nr:class I SAM-dependent methyltransferase [Shewanella dokdonensis]MCL1075289.1 methyltransferase domain-containing protein [Shewanella dokdonensis]QVK22006.1 methyltransferase domain-containing protein [Shewanella dokdonensis]